MHICWVHNSIVAALTSGLSHAAPVMPFPAQPPGPAATAPDSSPLTEQQKIEALIRTVRELKDAVFIRNGKVHDCQDAAEHLRTKWKMERDRIATAGDFIKHAANRSSQTSEPYLVRFKDGRELTSQAFLESELMKLEPKPAPPPDSQPEAPTMNAPDPNPPAEGFNLIGSDPKAIELADLTMQAMGGRKAWDRTRYIAWSFLGRRHVWDKHTGNIRVEFGASEDRPGNVILMNINTQEGRAWTAGQEITDPQTLTGMLQTAYGAWRNDGYWMFMPYKLKDSGVTLKYKGPAKMEDGRAAQVITLTFQDAHSTSKNKYEVYIADDDYLVGQWACYQNAGDEMPKLIAPWQNWKTYGRILLSDDRGPKRKHTGIAVFDQLPESAFTSPDPLDFSALTPTVKSGE